MDTASLQQALDDVFDQALVYHAYTDYLRDYEVIIHATADPRTGIPPAYPRYLFRHCVEVDVETAVSADIWRRSLDDRLIDYDTGKDLDGYVWGVRWQVLYPGAKVVPGSKRANGGLMPWASTSTRSASRPMATPSRWCSATFRSASCRSATLPLLSATSESAVCECSRSRARRASGGQQDALAEQAEAGPPIHLPLEHLYLFTLPSTAPEL